jgi:UDP-2,3-diacylglucosamine pyrophosphatase LpxH
VKHLIWRKAARTVVADYLGQAQKEDRPVMYCLMGHTHVPDYEESTVQNKQCLYLNSGTWVSSGDDVEDHQHATYLDVDAAGKVWLQDWIRNP